MSFTKKARNLRADGGSSRAGGGAEEPNFAVEVARALIADFGDTPSRIKVVARLTCNNEKTVKNWFQARNGPNGEGLVALMRHSDGVLRTVMTMAGREEILIAVEIVQARARLKETMTTIDRLLGEDEGPLHGCGTRFLRRSRFAR